LEFTGYGTIFSLGNTLISISALSSFFLPLFFLGAELLTYCWTHFGVQLCNFMIGLLFLSVVEKVGVSVVYLGFGSVCLGGALYVLKNVVETKGRSLEEIEREVSPVVYDDAAGFSHP
jgi:hypothetical protein